MFVHTTALRASPGGMTRVNQHDGDAFALCLIGDVCPQLEKRPAMQRCSLSASNRYPRPNTAQVFQGDAERVPLRLINDAFADRVIGVAGKATFFARQSLQFAACRIRGFRLQLLAQATVAVANISQVGPGIVLTRAVGRDPDDTQINAEKAFDVQRIGIGNLTGRRQIELPFAVNEITFALLIGQQAKLVIAGHKGDNFASTEQPDRNRLIWRAPVQDATIVRDGSELLEKPFGLLVLLVGIDHLTDTADHDLRGKSVLLTRRSLSQVMQRKATKRLDIPCLLTNPVAGGIGTFKCLIQKLPLGVVRLKFHECCQFHMLSIAANFRIVQHTERRNFAFFPRLKAGGSGEDVDEETYPDTP